NIHAPTGRPSWYSPVGTISPLDGTAPGAGAALGAGAVLWAIACGIALMATAMATRMLHPHKRVLDTRSHPSNEQRLRDINVVFWRIVQGISSTPDRSWKLSLFCHSHSRSPACCLPFEIQADQKYRSGTLITSPGKTGTDADMGYSCIL